MENIKLSGLKRIREYNNVSREKLAADINLINDSGVNFVITPEYIEKLENRKQRKIDDRLLELLTQYFDVTLEDMLSSEIQNNQEECTPGKKKLAITYNLSRGTEAITRLKSYIEVNEVISNKCLQETIDLIIKRFGILDNKEDFAHFVQVIIHVFNVYDTYIKFHNNKPLTGKKEKQFLEDALNELEYGDELNIIRLMGCAYKYFKEDLNLSEAQAQTLSASFIDVLLHNGKL